MAVSNVDDIVSFNWTDVRRTFQNECPGRQLADDAPTFSSAHGTECDSNLVYNTCQ